MTFAPSESTTERRVICARCGTSFGCGSPTGQCWCADETYRMPMPASPEDDCLCPACLRAAARMSGLIA